MTTWAISLHPEHWDAIVAGTKRYEIRRRLPTIAAGDDVIVYVTRPVGAVLGSFRVAEVVHESDAASLWSRIRDGLPGSFGFERLDDYMRGSKRGGALRVADVQTHDPIAPWFHPPQGFIRACDRAA